MNNPSCTEITFHKLLAPSWCRPRMLFVVFLEAVMPANIRYSVGIEWKDSGKLRGFGRGLDINYNKYLFSVLSGLYFTHSECKSTCVRCTKQIHTESWPWFLKRDNNVSPRLIAFVASLGSKLKVKLYHFK